jgi:hypothetical protein
MKIKQVSIVKLQATNAKLASFQRKSSKQATQISKLETQSYQAKKANLAR